MLGPLRLETDACVVRPWRASDKPSLLRHADDRAVWITLRDVFPHPYTPTEAERWLDHVRRLRPVTHFAIAVGEADEAVGGIGLALGSDVYRLSAEIGFWVGRAFWGRGIATAAVRAVTPWAFAQLGVERIWAGVFSSNPASMRVLEKAGYEREGIQRRAVVKNGAVLDLVLYATVRPGP